MKTARTNPKDMLRQIRELMSQNSNAQDRLDKLVTVIAQNMQTDICSIYLTRADNQMELWATKGLASDAVHQTLLAPGEGLVGEVVEKLEPVNVKNASTHRRYSFHPETQETKLLSFLGVPVLRSGQLLGVLVVQSEQERAFDADAVEVLQNVAMVLAEIVASGELIHQDEFAKDLAQSSRSQRLSGIQIVDGLAMGEVVLFEPHIVGASRIAEDPAHEIKRLRVALEELQQTLDRLFSGKGHAFGEPAREVLNAYRMFARDQSWFNRLRAAANAGLTAEAAVERVREEYRQRMLAARDPYLQERLHDLEDLANRLLRHLGGVAVATELPKNTILVARNIGPAELLELDRSKLRALVLEEGSRTSHAAIVASAMRLPVVGHVTGLLVLAATGDAILVDGENGEVLLRPAEATKSSFVERLRLRQQQRAAFAKLTEQPAISVDGQRVQLLLNAGLQIDLPNLATTGADGIGLFRTEFQFMLADHLPKQAQLIELYRQVGDAAKTKPVVFRTLDLGGDKILPYVSQAREANPALGWRAVRMALDRPGMFRYQLRALIHASAGRTLRIMFPLIATVSEFVQARKILEREVQRLTKFGHKNLPNEIKVGCMIETPALVWQLPQLLPLTDFISVGANDLMQYFFAADRENIRVADRYDPLHPGALAMLLQIVQQAQKHDVPLSICGEMAGRREDAAILLALGFRQLSVPASAIGPIKQMILSLDIGALQTALTQWLREEQPDVRKSLRHLAKKTKILL
ncbi:Phosphoenolpyruvate-protein phosphotransferase, nitrogen regulation associated [hydrothermal vent metagenome]|uniref:phosphoenolpyruvate--protein phosphotransferase n=1 Tax=hydrothermal vent metagenome TaxID=652676 RepID=A0A3B0SWY9_9ZZZZ